MAQFSFRSSLLLLLPRLWTLWATRSVVHKSTAGGFGFAQAVAAMGDNAENDRAEADRPAGGVLGEADRLAGERAIEVDELASPFDFAVRAHPLDLVVDRIVGLAQDAVPAPGRGLIVVGGGGVAERLVRALLIIETLKGAEAVELLAQTLGRRRGGVLEQGQMHALVATVLLRLAGRDPLRLNPGLDHQNRKARQPAKADGGERRAVVGAKPERPAELAERGVEHRPDMLGVAPSQRLTAQEIAAHRVGEGQRLATGAVAGQEPAREVDTPHVVGRPAMREGCARGRAPSAQLALHRQPLAIEHEPDRARRRPITRRRLPLEKGAHLHRPPGRMGPAHRNAALADPVQNRLRMRHRRPRAIEQTLDARFPIAREPFVAGLPAHPEPPADRRKRLLSLLNGNHEPHPLVHGAGLSPSHRQALPRRSVDLSPMSSVYSVTYVAGQDPSLPLSRRERGRGEGMRASIEGEPQFRANPRQDRIEIIRDFLVGEAQNAQAKPSENFGPPCVVVRKPFVLLAIEFDSEFG